MTRRTAFALLALPFAAAVHAADGYPTVDRVEYVLECMHANGGAQDHLYKCACAIDEIAQKLPYDDYVAASAVARYQGMAGERGGVFRDPENMKALAQRYRSIDAAARKGCNVKR